ncbi:DUF1836 domain-containing protein [Dellaglioa sp. BT-FLS60]
MSQKVPLSFLNWLDNLKEITLPNWTDFPELDLYMDQSIKLVNQYLEPLKLTPVTPTMVNNYVKKEIMFKPIKKRYHKEHLAAIIVITLLKSAFPLDVIKDGIDQLLVDNSSEEAYTNFALIFNEQVKSLTFNINLKPVTTETTIIELEQRSAASAVINHIISEKLVILMKEAPQS